MLQWLIEARGDKSQQKVAQLCGIHRGYYSLIELGKRKPSVEVAKKIGTALKFDWTKFF